MRQKSIVILLFIVTLLGTAALSTYFLMPDIWKHVPGMTVEKVAERSTTASEDTQSSSSAETKPSAKTTTASAAPAVAGPSKGPAGLSKTARIYSEMKPEEAAKIFDGMDDASVVSLMRKMDEQQAAKILSLMDKGRAAMLSHKLLLSKGTVPGTVNQNTVVTKQVK